MYSPKKLLVVPGFGDTRASVFASWGEDVERGENGRDSQRQKSERQVTPRTYPIPKEGSTADSRNVEAPTCDLSQKPWLLDSRQMDRSSPLYQGIELDCICVALGTRPRHKKRPCIIRISLHLRWPLDILTRYSLIL